jgi:hypothetical protein
MMDLSDNVCTHTHTVFGRRVVCPTICHPSNFYIEKEGGGEIAFLGRDPLEPFWVEFLLRRVVSYKFFVLNKFPRVELSLPCVNSLTTTKFTFSKCMKYYIGGGRLIFGIKKLFFLARACFFVFSEALLCACGRTWLFTCSSRTKQLK